MGVCERGVNERPRIAETPPKTKATEIIVWLYKTMLPNTCRRLRSRIRRVMEAGVNRLGEAGCRYTKEYVWKISGQYIHFHRSYDSFCKVRTFVLVYRPHPVYVQQPSHNYGSTWLIATISAPFDSAYGILSAVLKPVTMGDLCDIEGPRGHFAHIKAIGKSEHCVRPQKISDFDETFSE